MTQVLADFCNVVLGFKTLMNEFFYVGREDIERFGIEPQFLEPVFMLADLDDTRFRQVAEPKRWLFSCERRESDIRGSGAWKYIDWGAHQLAPTRKQSGRPETFRAALEKQGGKEWWWPKAPRHPAHLAVRKACNDRCAPFVFRDPVILDQRLYLLFPKEGISRDVLTAFTCSSLFALTLETSADLGLGAGALTLGAEGLRQLPCVDLRQVMESPGGAQVGQALSDVLKSRTATEFDLAEAAEVCALDEAILGALGAGPGRVKELHDAVAQLAGARLARSRQRQLVRAASSAADLERASEPIVDELNRWLGARVFPDDFVPKGAAVRGYHFPDGRLSLELSYFMGNTEIKVIGQAGEELLAENVNAFTGELILRALQLGRRAFAIPDDGDAASQMLLELSSMVTEFEAAYRQALERTSLGSLYERELGALVLKKLRIDMKGLTTGVHASGAWTVPA